jgi:predicted DNA-binding transcriptional regulator AlpA
VPKNPDSEGSPVLLTIDQIAAKHRVSRSSVHTYRRGGTFPRPVPVEGTTRVLFDAAEVAAWFHANPKRQGQRTDLPPKTPQQGDPMATQGEAPAALVLKDEILQRLYRSYGAKDVHTMSAAQKLLADYRAAELRHFLWLLEQSSGDAVAAKLVEDNPELAELLSATEG